MIEIRYKHHEIDISGHAEYGEAGKDLVCCAVSTLFYSLVENLNHITLNHLDVDYHKGLGHIKAVTWSENRTVDTMFDFTVRGLKLIEKNYPEYVKVFSCEG